MNHELGTSTLNRAHQATQAMLARVRALEAKLGVSAALLDQVKPLLTELAAQQDLFPAEHFPSDLSGVYLLAEDPDGRFALYAAAGRIGHRQPPHNHTTWACIAGVRGAEHNVFYQRTDDGGKPGWGSLRRTGELTVERGLAVAYLPNDFHTIEFIARAGDDAPPLLLHLYGLSLERLPQRIRFDAANIQALGAGPYRVFDAPPMLQIRQLSAPQVKSMIGAGTELALFDVREEGVFERAHPLFAANLPLSQLELRISALCPRRDVPIVLMDGGGEDPMTPGQRGLAYRAARTLMRLGWSNLAILRDGLPGWRNAGLEVFSGVNVPSKAFGEFIEQAYQTPHIEPTELKRWQDEGRDLLLLDSRPIEEFRRVSIPGAIVCPGAELAHRAFGLVRSAQTTVVVNCAGRTRSIIGAQSLRNAGLPNPIYALKDGTMGWQLAGLEPARGATASAPPPNAEALAQARAGAERIARRYALRTVDAQQFAQLRADSQRTRYLFDVRTRAEYEAGHPAGARHAPGGQLVQALDAFAPVRGAQIFLYDDLGIRNRVSASWLAQMGTHQVFVLDADQPGLATLGVDRGPTDDAWVTAQLGSIQSRVKQVDCAWLDERLTAVLVLDVDSSARYRRGHVPGAWWTIRARIAAHLPRLEADLAPDVPIVLTSRDAQLACLAAGDCTALTRREVLVLRGGTDAWCAAGLALQSGTDRMLEPAEDLWARPYEQSGDVEAAMHRYLRWEVDLPEQIARDGDARFDSTGAAHG